MGSLSRASRGARRRYFCRQESASSRCEQWRQRSPDRRQLSQAANSLKNVETIITGHSMTTMTMADLREYAEFNKEFLAVVREAKKAGKSVDDVAKTWKMPAKYTGYGAPQEARLKANIQVIYDELK